MNSSNGRSPKETTVETPLIDRELFFGDPEIAAGKLSPDGKYMSFIKPYKGVRNIWVKKREEDFNLAKPITNDRARPISSYFWSRNSKYILYVQDKAGNENFQVYAVEPRVDGKSKQIPKSKCLTRKKDTRAYIYEVARTKPNILYIGLNDRDPAWHDLYSLNIATGAVKLLRQNNDRITEWVFDRNDKLRLAIRSNEDGSTEFLRLDRKKMISIYDCSALESASVMRFHEDGQHLYVVSNKGDDQNLSKLILLNIITGKQKNIHQDPKAKVDFGSASFSDLDNRMIALYYEDDRIRIYWKDEKFKKDYLYLRKKFKGKEVSFTSGTKDERHWLIAAYSDTDHGAVYSYDRRTKKLKFQYRPRPLLNPEFMSKMKAITYQSSDGLEIPAYLTLPKGKPAHKLPMIVNPHGGPWVRDHWGFDNYAQFFANRGYAVLQMNYRGSTGFGKSFLDAGNREWGAKMQDDITWGVKHLIKQSIVHPKKVAIFGGSYGGYACLAGLAFTPHLYACGVSLVGPSSLLTLLASIPPYWESGRKMFQLRVGDPTSRNGRKELKEKSPLYFVDQIKTPLMIVQGANDPRVKKAESDQIVKALQKAKKEVVYLCAMDEGHGFAHPQNNLAFLAAAEKFLADHLGGRYQALHNEELQRRLRSMQIVPKI